jgi:hypothetical protein
VKLNVIAFCAKPRVYPKVDRRARLQSRSVRFIGLKPEQTAEPAKVRRPGGSSRADQRLSALPQGVSQPSERRILKQADIRAPPTERRKLGRMLPVLPSLSVSPAAALNPDIRAQFRRDRFLPFVQHATAMAERLGLGLNGRFLKTCSAGAFAQYRALSACGSGRKGWLDEPQSQISTMAWFDTGGHTNRTPTSCRIARDIGVTN